MTEARIHDRGYLSYDGPRYGPSRSMVDLGRHTIQRVLGIKRTFWQKVLPAFALLVAFVPAVVYIGIAALLSSATTENLVSPADYYAIVAFALILFTAFVAPEAICTDRRSGMLGLYLASPLNRDTYLLTKFTAVTLVLATMTIGPALLMLIAFSLISAGPSGIDDWLIEFAQILGSGLAMATFWAGLSTAVSSLTPRRSRASIAIFLGILVSSIVSGILTEELDVGDGFALLDLASLPIEVVQRIYGENDTTEFALDRLSTWILVLGHIGITIGFGLFARWRYQKLTDTA